MTKKDDWHVSGLIYELESYRGLVEIAKGRGLEEDANELAGLIDEFVAALDQGLISEIGETAVTLADARVRVAELVVASRRAS